MPTKRHRHGQPRRLGAVSWPWPGAGGSGVISSPGQSAYKMLAGNSADTPCTCIMWSSTAGFWDSACYRCEQMSNAASVRPGEVNRGRENGEGADSRVDWGRPGGSSPYAPHTFDTCSGRGSCSLQQDILS